MRDVVHGAEPVRQAGFAEAGMMRRDDTVIARQGVEPRSVGLQSFAGVEEQQWTSLAGFLDIECHARDGGGAAHGRFLRAVCWGRFVGGSLKRSLVRSNGRPETVMD